ncbi:MAG: peptidylprolyl isomerase [Chthoniobacterales bacterium]|nr:peptidylprolyl isomerase [Chthoniobacterales bacterium]
MINILRKNQKALWIVIALLCIPFVFYFSNSRVGPIGNNQFGKIYGRTISGLEFQRSARLFNLARDLGMFTFLQDMVSSAQSENEAYSDFTWNRLVLRHEGERLGIQPAPQEVARLVKSFRAFQGQSGFDINKYNEFAQSVLPSMGFNEGEIEELAADQLTLERLKEIIGTGVQIPEAESKENYDRAYGKVAVGVVRLRSDEIAKGVSVTDEDITKYFEVHKAELKSDERRQVNFVTFALSDEQKKLAGKERVEALQKVADQANDFNQALLEKDAAFDQVAAKFQLPVQTTGSFARATPDPLLSGNQQLASTAFQLTPEEPNSDPVQVSDAFYILHLSGAEAAKPLTLEEAKPKIVDAIKQERTSELVAAKGAEAAQKIREGLKTGGALDAAVQQIGLVAEKIPPFALADPPARSTEPGKPPVPETLDLQMIKGAVAEMNPSEVSEFLPTDSGGLVVVLEAREQPAADAYAAGKEAFNSRFERGKKEMAFYEWLRERRREAGVPSNITAEIAG